MLVGYTKIITRVFIPESVETLDLAIDRWENQNLLAFRQKSDKDYVVLDFVPP